MSDYFRRLAETLAGVGGKTFGGRTFGGNTFGGQTFGGNTFGGNQFGASAPPVQGPVTVQAKPPPIPAFEMPGGMADKYMPIGGYQAPQAATMPPSQHVSAPPQIAQAPQAPMMGMGGDVPIGMEMQGMKAPQPMGRNELERDYFNQLAQNPNGFGKPDWLARWLG